MIMNITLALMVVVVVLEAISIGAISKNKHRMGNQIDIYEIDKKIIFAKLAAFFVLIIFLRVIFKDWSMYDTTYTLLISLYLTLFYYNKSKSICIFENGMSFNNRYILWDELVSIEKPKKAVIIKTKIRYNSELRNSNIREVDLFIENNKKTVAL